jgi:hypothetical protein
MIADLSRLTNALSFAAEAHRNEQSTLEAKCLFEAALEKTLDCPGSLKRLRLGPGLVRCERFDFRSEFGSLGSKILLEHRAVIIDHESHNA